jgi:ribose transport system substrate-binding protein
MMTATCAQFPLIVSERTVEQGYRFLREDISYGEEVIVPVELITRDNVDRFNINGWQ